MSTVTRLSEPRQCIHAITPIAPPIAPPYHTRPDPGEDGANEIVLDLRIVLDHEISARAHEAADERGEDDLIRPVDVLSKLAQTSGDHHPAGEEAKRERHPERLDRNAEEVDFGLHGAGGGGDIGTR